MSRQRGEEAWRELVAKHVGIGVLAQAFCQRERLNVNTFYGWRSKLGARTTVSTDKTAVSKTESREPAGGFIDLGSLGGGVSRYKVRLVLGDGSVFRWWYLGVISAIAIFALQEFRGEQTLKNCGGLVSRIWRDAGPWVAATRVL